MWRLINIVLDGSDDSRQLTTFVKGSENVVIDHTPGNSFQSMSMSVDKLLVLQKQDQLLQTFSLDQLLGCLRLMTQQGTKIE